MEILRGCGGYYLCPKDQDGRRLGPLCGLAGTYLDERSGQQLHFVSDVYYNFAKAEEYPLVMDNYTKHLASYVKSTIGDKIDYFVGAPMGGIVTAVYLAQHTSFCRFVFAEKKVIALATESSREKTVLNLNRHELEAGTTAVIVEDVCTNFSTTEELRKLIENASVKILGIACLLNRSPMTTWKDLPVIALVHEVLPQSRQDDPAVAQDVAQGNVVWKVKNEWERLKEAIQAHPR
ncbi:MAG: phosphoribosyltransferase [bacterium]|nr:phosphoribosyltransferase [bacterium]